MLQFKDESGKVVLTGSDLKDAKAQVSQGNQAVVGLEFNDEGGKKFADLTARNVGKKIAIELDGQVLTAPVVQEAITGGHAQISGSRNVEEAEHLAILLRSGSLLYVMLLLLVMRYLGATLTLPGIAGIILSVGMAVDANVLIFERFKEEVKRGKTLRSAMDSGFGRAIVTILDSNLTTIMAAAVLFYLGTGPIKGFAVTLALGTLLSMFTAVTVTKFLLRFLIYSNITKSPFLFGAKAPKAKEEVAK